MSNHHILHPFSDSYLTPAKSAWKVIDDEGMERTVLIDNSLSVAATSKNDDPFHWLQFDFGKAMKVGRAFEFGILLNKSLCRESY